jgi:hypothetical protein
MRRRNSRFLVLTVMAGLIGFAVVAGVIGAMGGNPAVRTATTTTLGLPTTTLVQAGPLGATGEALDSLLAAGRKSKFHAVYTVADPKLGGIQQSLEVWRDGDRLRADIIEKGWEDGTRRITDIDNGRTKRKCTTRAGEQSCQIVDALPLDLPAFFVQGLVDEKPKATITTRNDDIAGYQAKCFAAKDVGELCLTTDGVMLFLEFQDATVTAEIVEDAVPESAFDVSG